MERSLHLKKDCKGGVGKGINTSTETPTSRIEELGSE
jgi:hypothetical protein